MGRKLVVAAMLVTMGLGVQLGPASAAGVGTPLYQCKARAHENFRTRVNNGQDRSAARRRLNQDLKACKRRFG
ncbi:MAG TPA: hypothetical protein VFA83_22225 [Acidimicrobiales bacterium]|nr:hypothetical protein [Acidimicrobiales bacterium]